MVHSSEAGEDLVGAKLIKGRGTRLMSRVDVRNLLNSWTVGRVIEGSGRDYQILFHGWNRLPSCTTNSKQGLDIAPEIPLATSRNTARSTPVLRHPARTMSWYVTRNSGVWTYKNRSGVEVLTMPPDPVSVVLGCLW